MKKIKLLVIFLFTLLILTGCGKLSLNNTVKNLLDGMIDGSTNEVVRKYCINHEILLSSAEADEYSIRRSVFSKMSYEIKSKVENETTGEVVLDLKTVDVSKVLSKVKEELKDDAEYNMLVAQEKNNYLMKKERDFINDLSDDSYFRVVEIKLKAKKINDEWKIEITNEFVYAVSGMKY